MDEARDLLKEGEVSVFMEHAYRKFRKYGGSVVIATQSINDLYENAVGRAIAENSASMYLLGQTEETVESVKRSGRLTLSEGGFHTSKRYTPSKACTQKSLSNRRAVWASVA